MSENCPDCRLLRLEHAAEILNGVASPVAAELRNFLSALPPRKARQLPIFEVQYRYGQQVFGLRSGTDNFAKILAPCSSAPTCEQCRRLLEVFHHHRPLIFVLEGSCEEYTEYDQSSPPIMRRVPLRFHSVSDTIGLTQFLNQLYLPDKPARSISGRMARRMAAGAQSVFLTSSVSNPRLAGYLLHMIAPKILRAHLGKAFTEIPLKQLGKNLDGDHGSFCRLIADAAVAETQHRPWKCRLLFVPVDGLTSLLRDADKTIQAQRLLVALLSKYFLESRNNRSDFLRQTVVFDRLSGRTTSAYAARTVHHLIEVLRGEFPGFVPHDPTLGDDWGPFSTIHDYIEKSDIGSAKYMDRFPMLLRPAHLDGATRRYVYYSLERPTLVAPVGGIQSVRSFATEVNDGLNHLAENRPELFDSARWRFLISKGKPEGPQAIKRSSQGENRSARFLAFQEDQQIADDFRAQIQNAQTRKWLSADRAVFGDNKWGFMGAFVRISLSSGEARK